MLDFDPFDSGERVELLLVSTGPSTRSALRREMAFCRI